MNSYKNQYRFIDDESLEEALEARRQGEMTYFGKFRYLDNQYVKKENVTT